MVVDRQKLIEAQTHQARRFYVKLLHTRNEAVTGYVVTKINPHGILFLQDSKLLEAYIEKNALENAARMLNETFIFECSVAGRNKIIIKFLS